MNKQAQFFIQAFALAGLILLTAINPARAEFLDKEFLEEEKDAIERVSKEWAKQVNARDPVKIVAFYNNPFILYATFKTKIDTEEGLMKYFKDLTSKDNIRVVFDDQNIRVRGPAAINSGLYTFTYTEHGKTKKVPARFTFVYTLTTDGWKIIDHHSSELPE